MASTEYSLKPKNGDSCHARSHVVEKSGAQRSAAVFELRTEHHAIELCNTLV